jgi:hypothetical protein
MITTAEAMKHFYEGVLARGEAGDGAEGSGPVESQGMGNAVLLAPSPCGEWR